MRTFKNLNRKTLHGLRGLTKQTNPEQYDDFDLAIAWELYDRLVTGDLVKEIKEEIGRSLKD